MNSAYSRQTTWAHAKSAAILMAIALVFAALAALGTPGVAQATPTNATDVTTASEGNVMLMAKGAFATDKQAALDYVNTLRKEACTAGNVPDPRDSSRMLSASDYVPIKWSTDLEWIAQIRAAESLYTMAHERTNGASCFGISHNGVRSWGEVLAWGMGTIKGSCSLWATEKSSWVAQDSSAVTGHYTQMINPSNTYMGMANFSSASSYGYGTCGAGEFSSATSLTEGFNGISGAYLQWVEVQASKITGVYASIGNVTKGASTTARLGVTYNGKSNTGLLLPASAVTWTSNATKVATVSGGTVKGKGCGNAKLTGTVVSNAYSALKGKTASAKVKVVPKAPTLKSKKYTAKKTTLKWKKVAGVSGYQIKYYKKQSGYYKSKSLKVGSKTTKQTLKKAHYVQIRSYQKSGGKTYYSAWTTVTTK